MATGLLPVGEPLDVWRNSRVAQAVAVQPRPSNSWRNPATNECGHCSGMERRPELSLVVDASVGLNWILEEPDSNAARALPRSNETLRVPDFWLNEACNIL